MTRIITAHGLKKENRPYLHIKNLPVDEITDEILIIRLDFGDSSEWMRAVQSQRSCESVK